MFLLALLGLATSLGAAPGLHPNAAQQIERLLEEKRSWTPAQAKLESALIHALKQRRGQPFGVPGLELEVSIRADGRVLVDLNGLVTASLLSFIQQRGGQVVNSFVQFDAVRAWVPVVQLEMIAERPDVRSIRRADQAATSVGSILSEADVTHRAGLARTNFGVTGAGVKIGILSDSIDFLAESQAAGDLGTVTILPGQAGVGSGEGTAMLEVIHDLAPDAQLFFATALNGQASFAQNILDLRSNGCDIIVDDAYYFNESPFQDALIAQAVNSVTAGGALYFSAAGNSGNFDSGNSGTWEGDFVDGGAVSAPLPGSGRVHSFEGVNFNTVTPGGSQRRVDLFWSDPLGNATNDYDLFVLNETGTAVLRSSMTRQLGAQDPYESVSALNVGERIVVVKFSGASRFLHLGTGRGRLSIATPGAVLGHPTAEQAFCVAAVDASSAFPGAFLANPFARVEPYSSDGPRRVFYHPNGTAITPGNFLAGGGSLRNKPDLTAADGVMTTVPGFQPFVGTSVAAPHAAAIAALLRSLKPSLTIADFRRLLNGSALDIEDFGPDRNSGVGIVMAQQLLEAGADELWIRPGEGFVAAATGGGPVGPASTTFTLTNAGSSALSWTLVNTTSWLTVSTTNGTLAAAGPAQSVLVSLSVAGMTNLGTGVHQGTVWFTNVTTGTGRSRTFTLLLNQPRSFTEHFEANNSLDHESFLFTPNGSIDFYELCWQPAAEFPTDPTGGTVLSLADDDSAQVTLSGTNSVALYGHRTNVFFIGSNGYLTMDAPDTQLYESLANHFSLRRISAMFDDLSPDTGGSVSWKEVSDRVAVTYLAVPEFGDDTQTNSFQVELYFDGRIRLTYLDVQAEDGLTGLSAGQGLPAFFREHSYNINTACLVPMELSLPASVSEGDGVLVGAGEIRIPLALGTNVNVSLFSNDAGEITVPGSVTILAGQTNVTFDLTVIDDANLDGTQQPRIFADAAGFTPINRAVTVLDNESAALALNALLTVNEGAGVITGLVTASSAPAEDIVVLLNSSDTNELQVPPSLVLPTGTTSAPINLTVVDDLRIDGDQLVTLTAQIPNWTNAQVNLLVVDNETTNLTLQLPSTVREGNGLLANAGRVSLSGTLPTNLVVSLTSSNLNEIVVPPNATVIAGQTSAVFNITVVNDAVLDGPQSVGIQAAAAGFNAADGLIQVNDDETPLAPTNPSPAHLATGIAVTNDLAWSYPAGEEEQLLVNGDFESGSLGGWVAVASGSGGFIVNSGTNDPPSPDGPTVPYAGSFSALARQTGPGLQRLYQDVALSSNATLVSVSWVDRVRNFAASFGSNQQFRVELRNTNDVVLALLHSTQPSDPLLGDWVERSADISNYRGQTVRIAFVVDPGLGLLDVHLDEVKLLSTAPPATSYDVYFGTNAIPGTNDFVGTTTNTSWSLPTLAPMTTYYWQVVAKRSGETAGPIWQFSTRGVHHFEWANIPSPQYLGEPINVAIFAKDEFNTTVSNFTGQVSLRALTSLDTNSLLQVPITPAQSGAFVNGAWAGQVAVLQPATNLWLEADDGQGHSGIGNSFHVLVINDLLISMNDSPDPVLAGANLAYSLLISNTGPQVSEGIRLTNQLPATANLVAVGLSQGTYTNFAGLLVCDLGSLGAGSNLFVTIFMSPTLGGRLTNVATVSRSSAELYLENNVASAITTVLPVLSVSNVAVVEGLSGMTQAVVNLRLSPPSLEAVQVAFATSNGTALAGSDYTSTNGVLQFNPGVTNVNLAVPVMGDSFYESNETFTVNFSAPTGAVLSNNPSIVTILNDDLLLAPIADRSVNEGALLTFIASNNAALPGTVFTITDFEGFTNGTANGTVLLRDPRTSGSTVNLLNTTPNISSVTNNFPAGHNSSRALRVSWSWVADAIDPWLRLSTFNATFLSSPVIPFNQSIRFDLHTDRALKLGLGVRENNSAAPVGVDGGSGGNVEFIGVTSTTGNTPIPTRTIPSNTWTTVQFDLPFEAISGLTGNGILESTTGKGVLDHLALVPDSGLGTYNIYLDNLVVVSNRFLYSLEPGAPAGATIHPVNGTFRWTPTETQGPGLYSITVRLSDTTSALFATQTFNVTVIESNTAPSLNAIADRTIAEGSTLLVTNLATDTDLPAHVLTFSLGTNAPAGAGINPTNGLFTWAPSEAQGPSTNAITIRVTDNGTPPLNDSKTFTVIVTEVNSAPVLTPVTDRWVHLGSTLRITNIATDVDLPANSLTFSLGSAPAGASLGASSGILVWTPPGVLGTNAFTVRVADNGSPPLTNTISFNAIVIQRPTILSMQLAGTNVALVWSAAPGISYELQYKSLLADSNWTALTPPITASGFTAGRTDSVGTTRFYRVHVLP